MKMRVNPKLSKVNQDLQRAASGISNLSGVHRAAAALLDKWVQRNFETEGGNVGGWKPFAAGGRWKNGTLDTTAKLLQDAGTLKSRFLPFSSNKNAGIGNDLPYSKTHELGQGLLPARRMLPRSSDEKLMGEIEDLFKQHGLDSFKKSGVSVNVR